MLGHGEHLGQSQQDKDLEIKGGSQIKATKYTQTGSDADMHEATVLGTELNKSRSHFMTKASWEEGQ